MTRTGVRRPNHAKSYMSYMSYSSYSLVLLSVAGIRASVSPLLTRDWRFVLSTPAISAP